MDPWLASHELRLEVRGEHFVVRPSQVEAGQYAYEWTSGPVLGHGFTGGFSGPVEATVADHVTNIESFLDEMAPDVGWQPRNGS